ncbi:unnamed protein product [Durusdinium trenchii]|uniref:HTH La-type RNA-binding domain-containing protein n=1 Tax=Durusdinium trenchii TaxID=1381693 RepID=A0ABP0JEV2_9DINO
MVDDEEPEGEAKAEATGDPQDQGQEKTEVDFKDVGQDEVREAARTRQNALDRPRWEKLQDLDQLEEAVKLVEKAVADRQTRQPALIRQLAFYFSDGNLRRDRFLREKIVSSDDGFVPISVILPFNRLKLMGCSTRAEVCAAVEAAEAKFNLELSEQRDGIRRRGNVPPPPLSFGGPGSDFEKRSVQLAGFPTGATPEPSLEEVTQLCEPFGVVAFVRLLREVGSGGSSGTKPFAGRVEVEFQTEEAAVAQRLREVYEAKFAFPSWSCERLGEGSLEVYAQSVTVYYPQGAQLAEVKRLVREREPVNIGMKRRYDQQKMQEYFGYATGAYGRLSSSERLGPNLAVYCRTPMRAPDGRERDVHVINVIGFAFDKTQQPDYQYFLNHDDEDGRRAELVKKMSQMWEYIYFCAHEKKLKCVRLSQVGGGAFSLLLGGNFDYQALRKESLEPVMARYPEIETKELQFIPDWVFTPEGERCCSSSLLVNAWDPWSFVGNGNAGDNSLDGYFGRCTAMAVLCWPDTNPCLQLEDRYRLVPP